MREEKSTFFSLENISRHKYHYKKMNTQVTKDNNATNNRPKREAPLDDGKKRKRSKTVDQQVQSLL